MSALGWEITVGPNREGYELEKADLFPTRVQADNYVCAYRGARGYRTAVKPRTIKIDRANFKIFAAVVWRAVEVTS